MKRRLACITACLSLALLSAACGGGGDNGPSGPVAKGADVCNDLKQQEKLRYTINYALDSPQQQTPPDNSTAQDWALKPSFPDFKFETSYDGAFVQPDKFDFQLTVPPEPGVRSIRVGQGQWYLLNNSWVPSKDPTPPLVFTPAALCDAIVSPLDLAGQTGVAEKVGDVDTQHIHIPGAALTAGGLLGDQSDNSKLLKSWDVDLWLKNNGARLVKAEANAKTNYPYGRELSSKLSLEVNSFNDDNIGDIKPPI